MHGFLCHSLVIILCGAGSGMTRRMSTCWTLTTRLMDWLDRMIPQMAEAAGASEELKARDQMAWVRLMNNCKARVEEIICAEIIYC